MLTDDDLAAWVAGLDDLFALVAGRFGAGGAAAAGACLCAGPISAAGGQERVDAGGGGRGHDAGRDAAAAERGGLGRGRGPR